MMLANDALALLREMQEELADYLAIEAPWDWSDYTAALSMAIEALEQRQPQESEYAPMHDG